MFPEANAYVGIDVAKQSVQVDGLGLKKEIKNESSVLRRTLEQWQRRHPTLHLVCEPSGGYERVLVALAHGLQIPVSVVNARQARDFARSIGRLEKTDRVDAEVLRLYGEKLQPKPTEQLDPRFAVLREWIQSRDYYVAQLRSEKNRLEQIRDQALRKVIAAQLDHLAQVISDLEQHIERFLQEQAPELNDKVQTLCLVSGVGAITAVSLIAHLPELGRLDGPAITKLAGLAPLCQESGTWRGQRQIRHGRSAARRALYLAALVAARHNEHLRPVYLRLRAAGKPPKLALVAIARKLLLFLNKLLKPASLMPV